MVNINNIVLTSRSHVKFVAQCDDLMFGVTEDGLPFHTGNPDWSPAEQLQWAWANANFNLKMGSHFVDFAHAIERLQRANAEKPQPANESREEPQQQNEPKGVD